MSRVQNKVAIVTGAARGHGAALAELLLDEGARVALADVEPVELPDGAGDRAVALSLDVRSPQGWAAAVVVVLERWGRLDVLVNNAGIMRPGSIEEQSSDAFMDMVEVNQLGTWLGMKAVVAPMRRGGGGSIINMSSVGGLMGVADNSGYCATKWAVRGMTKCAALELAADGIRVNSVHPGAMDTTMPHAAGVADPAATIGPRVPLGRIADVRDVVAMVLFLASEEAAYCTGAEFIVDGGMSLV